MAEKEPAEFKIGPLRIRWWRLWLLTGAWGLGAGLVASSILFLSGHTPDAFQPDEPAAIAARVRDASTEIERGRPEVAAQRLEAIRDEDPLNPYIHALLGRALGRVPDRLHEAIASTRMAVSLDPLFTEAWYNLACLYGRADDANGAIRSLAEAAALGFNDADLVASDPDLKLIANDSRVQYFLSFGHMPAGLYFAEVTYEPAAPRLGEPFDMVLVVWALNWQAGEDLSVSYLGPGRSRLMQPVARTLKGGDGGVEGARRWEARYRLRPLTAYTGALGPWDVRVGGRRLAPKQAGLKISGGPSAKAAPFEEAYNPRVFFAVPWNDVASPTGRHWAEGFEGAWTAGSYAVELSPFPTSGAPAAGELWMGDDTLPRAYDEWILPPEGGPPAGLRRVFLRGANDRPLP